MKKTAVLRPALSVMEAEDENASHAIVPFEFVARNEGENQSVNALLLPRKSFGLEQVFAVWQNSMTMRKQRTVVAFIGA